MTKEKLIAELKDLKRRNDIDSWIDRGQGEVLNPEFLDHVDGHMEADGLLIQYINDDDIAEAYNALDREFSY